MDEETSTENFSLSDGIRDVIQKAFDNNVDLTVESNRSNLKKQFKEQYPKENKRTIDAIFSKELPKIAKAYNVDPDETKRKPSKKYSESNEIKVNTTEKKSGVATVSIKNPDTLKQGSIQNQQQAYKYEIKSSQLGAFADSVWGIGQVFSEDLEGFTKQEIEDLGDLWQPVAQAKLGNNDRGQVVLAVGGTIGIVARKAKTAKANRKIRKEKEKKERDAKSQIEPESDGDKKQ